MHSTVLLVKKEGGGRGRKLKIMSVHVSAYLLLFYTSNVLTLQVILLCEEEVIDLIETDESEGRGSMDFMPILMVHGS